MNRALILLVLMVSIWAMVAVPMHYWTEGPPFAISWIGLLVCLVPGLTSLLVASFFASRPAEDQLFGILLSIGTRMSLTIVAGVAVYFLSPIVRANAKAFLLWGLGLYLVGLILETKMLYSQVVATKPESHPRNG